MIAGEQVASPSPQDCEESLRAMPMPLKLALMRLLAGGDPEAFVAVLIRSWPKGRTQHTEVAHDGQGSVAPGAQGDARSVR